MKNVNEHEKGEKKGEMKHKYGWGMGRRERERGLSMTDRCTSYNAPRTI